MTDQPEVIGWDTPPRRGLAVPEIDPAHWPSVAVTIGVSLVSAAVVISAMYSRETGDLDVSNFAMGALCSLALLVIAAGVLVLRPELEEQASLASWTGVAAVLGTSLMVAVLIDDNDGSLYTSSILAIALSVGCYLLLRAAPFVLSTIVGAAFLYGKAFEDLIDTSRGDDGETKFIIVGAGILVFALLATAAGWLLPRTRVLSSVVVGAGTVIAFTFLFQAMFFLRTITSPYAEEFDDPEHFDNPYINDMWTVLAYCAVLVTVWAFCSLATGHVGFRILIIAITVISVPVATYVLAVEHPPGGRSLSASPAAPS